MRATAKIVDKDRGYSRLKRELTLPGDATLTVGIHAEDGAAMSTPSHPTGAAAVMSVRIIDIAVWNEFGTLDGRIPPRPFIRGYVDGQEERIRAFARAAMRQVVTGKLSTGTAVDRVGIKMVGEIQRAINVGFFGMYPENAPYTIAKKGSSTPLVDTGVLRSSIRDRVVFA